MKRWIIAMTAALAVGGSTALAGVFDMGGTRNPDGSWNGLASLEFVTVGNPGNEPDVVHPQTNPENLRFGAVGYEYRIGKYEITAAQYTEFLNAVAATDPYGLYNTLMWTREKGCKIRRDGQPNNYSYSVAADYANRPVNPVTWGDAARFCNWLHNGQPAGSESWITETGAYTLNGATTNAELLTVTRNPGALYWIPTEDEWYKAAYYDPTKDDTGGYWRHATQSDVQWLSNRLIDPDPGNNVTCVGGADNPYTVGSPYWRTEVGAHENSESYYGTFDQAGNVWEWNESIVLTDYRGLRGGAYGWHAGYIHAGFRGCKPPADESRLDYGFRVASAIPEPSTLIIWSLLGGLAVTVGWSRRMAW